MRHSSARSNIAIGARTRKPRYYPPFLSLGKSLNTEIDEILNNLGIAEVSDEPVKILSGGQQRRVAIARALIKGLN